MSASSYANVQSRIETPREIEIRAFRYVNGLLTAASDTAARATALHKAHRLWSILLGDLAGNDNKLPVEVRANLVSLGLWAQREALARLSDGRGVEPLVALHRDMIEALEAQRTPAPPPEGVRLGAVSA